MSVEAPKTVEETPVVDATKAVPDQPEAATSPVETSAAPVQESSSAEPAAAAAATTTEETSAAPVTEEVKKDEPIVEAMPTSEGTLGYKEPGFFKKFIYTKHFFWFSEEPSTAESLSSFIRQEKEKADTKYSSAAWARESGKGLLFYAKRAEDKAAPAGIINLSEATAVTKEGLQQFSFRVGSHHHRFEATNSKERDSWIVAIEKAVGEAKELKDELTSRETYKKNVEEYSKPTVVAAAALPKSSRSKSKEPKKSLDAATATAAATTPAAVAGDNASTSSSSSDEASNAAKKDKERSQSRKRGSIFGTLLGKKDEHAEKKEEKAEAKKELKEEKKVEAEEKKEEAKASDEPTTSNAVEAAEASTAAAAIAAVPATIVATDKEDKEEVTPTPAEKKSKRGSVFGSLFKKSVTSPTAEKTEKDATTSDVPPVSETAPKLDEPIENKPIDTAAVTAPADNVETPGTSSVEPAKDTTTPAAAETATTPKAEKKGGILGFIKKTEAKFEGKKEVKEEAKEEQAAEAIAKDPVTAAAAPESASEPATTEATTEPATKEERPARDNQRRTSLFFKNKKETTSDTEGTTETKREKSPLPGKFIGNLVRRASKAVKSEPKEKPATEATPAETATKDVPVETTPAVTEPTESKIVGDVVPETLHATPETAAPASAPEVKATA